MTNLAELVAKVEQIPDATPEQWEAARIVAAHRAPDLADVIFGLAEKREADQRVRLERGLRGARS